MFLKRQPGGRYAELTIRVDRNPAGPRVYCAGKRVHHGTAGAAALAIGILTRRRAIALSGAIAIWHDRLDFPFRDCDNH